MLIDNRENLEHYLIEKRLVREGDGHRADCRSERVVKWNEMIRIERSEDWKKR